MRVGLAPGNPIIKIIVKDLTKYLGRHIWRAPSAPPPPPTTDETARVRCSSADAPTFEPGKATQPLAEETSAALRDLLTDDTGK